MEGINKNTEKIDGSSQPPKSTLDTVFDKLIGQLEGRCKTAGKKFEKTESEELIRYDIYLPDDKQLRTRSVIILKGSDITDEIKEVQDILSIDFETFEYFRDYVKVFVRTGINISK